jgi:hypothetical protein
MAHSSVLLSHPLYDYRQMVCWEKSKVPEEIKAARNRFAIRDQSVESRESRGKCREPIGNGAVSQMTSRDESGASRANPLPALRHRLLPVSCLPTPDSWLRQNPWRPWRFNFSRLFVPLRGQSPSPP